VNAPFVARQRDWWLLVLRGIAAVFFALAAFLWPGLTLAALVLIFGAYAIVDGLLSIYTAIRRHEPGQWEWHLVQGLLGIGAGFVAIVLPGLAALALVVIVAAWAILMGIAEIALALRLRDRLAMEALWFLAGLLSVLVGIALVAFPAAGALAVTWLIGAYALFMGLLFITLGISIRAAARAVAI
jgi:uncharacterized membrane protein HdeD (DUF308 family)